MKIFVETTVKASLDKVWAAWITPNDITQWNFANNDWTCPNAEVNFKKGGTFNYRMEAKDGSMGFDFCGKYTAIDDKSSIDYVLEDDRIVQIIFNKTDLGVKLTQSFDSDLEHAVEQQKQGWQAILNNFKQYVENTPSHIF